MSTPFSLSLFPSHCFPLPFQLRKTIPDCPSCPLKKRLIVWSPVFLDQRRVELLDWIRTVCLTVLCLRICTSVTCVCVSLSFSVRRVCVYVCICWTCSWPAMPEFAARHSCTSSCGTKPTYVFCVFMTTFVALCALTHMFLFHLFLQIPPPGLTPLDGTAVLVRHACPSTCCD